MTSDERDRAQRDLSALVHPETMAAITALAPEAAASDSVIAVRVFDAHSLLDVVPRRVLVAEMGPEPRAPFDQLTEPAGVGACWCVAVSEATAVSFRVRTVTLSPGGDA